MKLRCLVKFYKVLTMLCCIPKQSPFLGSTDHHTTTKTTMLPKSALHPSSKMLSYYMWSDNKVRKLIAVKVLHTSLLKTTVVTFKVLSFRSYAPMTAPSPPFKTILKLVLWNDLQSCHCIIPDVINVIKMPSFEYFLYFWEQKEVTGGYIW